jgi:hypothetical protein
MIPMVDDNTKKPMFSTVNILDGKIPSSPLVDNDRITNPIEAKLHLKRFKAKAHPVQWLSHTMNPKVIVRGADRAATIPKTNVIFI